MKKNIVVVGYVDHGLTHLDYKIIKSLNAHDVAVIGIEEVEKSIVSQPISFVSNLCDELIVTETNSVNDCKKRNSNITKPKKKNKKRRK